MGAVSRDDVRMVMRGRVGRIVRAVACAVAAGWVGCGAAGPALAQAKPPQGQPPAAKAAQPAAPKPFDVCKGLTGANAQQKVVACTEAIKDGNLAGGDLALAYLNRGQAESGEGSEARSKADYRSAIRIFNELILAQPLNPYYYMQRGVVYQTIGEADRAILDFSDAHRIAPTQTFPLISRGVALYTRKDNNSGAIADFNAALKINPREMSAYINRGIVHRKLGELGKAIDDFTAAIKLLPPKIDPVSERVLPDAVAGQLSSQKELERNHIPLQAAFVYFQRGLSYYDKQEYDRAIADFSEAIRLNPNEGSAYVGRGATYLYKDELKKAIADFSEAIRLSPGQAFSYMQRGIAYHRTGDADQAIADYTEAHKLTPKDPSPLVNRGIVYYTKKGRFDAAIEDFDEALKLNPKEVNALINRGVTYRQKNDPDRAIVDFNLAVDLGLQTASLLKLVAKDRDPQTAQLADQVAHAYYQRGMALIDKQNYEEALLDFARALEITPKDSRPYLGRGAAYLKMNRMEEALKDLDEAVKISPGLSQVYFERGTAYHRVDDYARAIADYSESIKLDPKEPLAYINRGMAEIFLNKVDAAIEDFDKALELTPDNVNALIQRGFAYGLKKEFALGFADLAHALRLTPDNPTAYFYRAQVEAYRGNVEKALEDYASAQRYDPNNPRVYAARATVYLGLGDFESAIDDLNDAIRLRPRDPNQYLNRGIAYFSIGEYAKAISDYSDALSIDHKLYPALNNRCMAKAALGADLASARDDCTTAQKLNPGDPFTSINIGLIDLKQGQYAKAIEAYNAALAVDPQRARAYYGRGVAKIRLGDKKGGEADIDVAKGLLPNVAEEYATYGVKQ